jgi:hypothetical protein
MYLQPLYERMEGEADWVEVDFSTLQSLRKELGKQLDNLYVRDSIDPQDTHWTGIVLYDHASGDIPYFKYEVKGEYRHFYYNKETV